MWKKQTFVQGAIILMAASIINRIIGFVPRMLLPRIIGPEGIGLYQMGYPLLILVLTAINSGIPLAVAKLVAEGESEGNERKVRRVLNIAFSLSVTLGLSFTAATMLAARWLAAHMFTDARVYYTLVMMSPIILFVSVSAVFRGYFQGRQNMIPTAASQITETVVRCIAVLYLANLLLPRGLAYAAAGAMAGVLAGEIAALVFLLIQYISNRGSIPEKRIAPGDIAQQPARVFRRFLRISVPVTAAKLVGSASYFLESIMIVQSLAAAGISTHIATAQYGALQGMVMPVLFLPTAFTFSLAVSLVPSLSEAAARRDFRGISKRLHQSQRLALVLGTPFVLLMLLMAKPICLLLYNDESVADMLQWMAPVALFIYLQAPLQAALQALDRPGTALLNTFIGACVKLTLIYVLAAKAGLGIAGAVIAVNVNIVLVTLLHWKSVRQMTGFRFPAADLRKLAMAVLVTAGACLCLNRLSGVPDSPFLMSANVLFAFIVYIFAAAGLKLVDGDDFARIPWFGKWLGRRKSSS